MSSSRTDRTGEQQQGPRRRDPVPAITNTSAPTPNVDWSKAIAAYNRVEETKKENAYELNLVHNSLKDATGLVEKADFPDKAGKDRVLGILTQVRSFMKQHHATALAEAKVAAKAVKTLDADNLDPEVIVREEALMKQAILYMHKVGPSTSVRKACEDLLNVVITVHPQKRIATTSLRVAQRDSAPPRRTATHEPAAPSGSGRSQFTTNQSRRPVTKQQMPSSIPTGRPSVRLVRASARTGAAPRATNQVPASRQQKKEPVSKEAADKIARKTAEAERQAAAAKEKARREEAFQLAQEADQEKERQKKADAVKAAEKEAAAAETRREQKNTADAQLDTHGQSSNMPAPGPNSAVVAPKKTMTLKAYTNLKKKAKPEKKQAPAEEEQQESTPSSQQINGDEGSSTPEDAPEIGTPDDSKNGSSESTPEDSGDAGVGGNMDALPEEQEEPRGGGGGSLPRPDGGKRKRLEADNGPTPMKKVDVRYRVPGGMKRKRFDEVDISSSHKRMRQFAPTAEVDDLNINSVPAPTEAQLSWAALVSRHTSRIPTTYDSHDLNEEL